MAFKKSDFFSDHTPQKLDWDPFLLKGTPILALQNSGQTVVKLSDYIRGYKNYARFRIKGLKVLFMDKYRNVLPRQKIDNATSIRISFPSHFIDRDPVYNEKFSFYSPQHWQCTSSYYKNYEKSK